MGRVDEKTIENLKKYKDFDGKLSELLGRSPEEIEKNLDPRIVRIIAEALRKRYAQRL